MYRSNIFREFFKFSLRIIAHILFEWVEALKVRTRTYGFTGSNNLTVEGRNIPAEKMCMCPSTFQWCPFRSNGTTKIRWAWSKVSILQKSRCALRPTCRAANMNQPIENQPTFNTCNSTLPSITRTTNDQHSSSACKGTSGLLHITESNTMIFWLF